MTFVKGNTSRGFTLIELMITIAIVAIAASIAFSDSGNILAKERAENHLAELKKQFMLARAKATTTEAIVIVCPLSAGVCTNNWAEDRVTVFVDDNESFSFDPNDTILREIDPISRGDELSFSGASTVAFDATGRVGTNQAGDFVYCPSTGDDTERTLTLSQSGTTFMKGKTTTGCG